MGRGGLIFFAKGERMVDGRDCRAVVVGFLQVVTVVFKWIKE